MLCFRVSPPLQYVTGAHGNQINKKPKKITETELKHVTNQPKTRTNREFM